MKKILIYLVITFYSIFSTSQLTSAEWTWEGLIDQPMGVVSMEATILQSDLLKVDILAQEMLTPVLGAAYHLEYPEKALTFLRYDPGNFLERGGDPFYLVTPQKGDSKIIFGSTLKREDSFPVGDGVLGTFYFQILDQNSSIALEFSNGVISTLEVVRQDIDRIIWDNLYLEQENGQLLVSQNSLVETDLGSSKSAKTNYLLFTIGTLALMSFLVLLFLIKQSPQKLAQ